MVEGRSGVPGVGHAAQAPRIDERGTCLVWLWAVERTPPDRWDLLGAAIALVGAGVIVFSPRAL